MFKLKELGQKVFVRDGPFLLLLAVLLAFLPFFVSVVFVGLLGLLFVGGSAHRWGVRGGLVSSCWAGGLVLLALFMQGGHIKNTVVSVAMYFVLGLAFGKGIDVIREQRAALRESVARQELLLNNIDAQVWYLKDPETYGVVNRAHAEFLGLASEELQGLSLPELRSEGEVELCVERNRRVFEEAVALQTEEQVTNHAGELCTLSVSKNPKLDDRGEVQYVVCTAVDVTEQKRLEDELRASRNRLELILASTPAVVYAYELVDGKPDITYLSDNIENVLGYQPEELLHSFSKWLELIHPQDLARLRPTMAETPQPGVHRYYEYRFRDKDGDYRWIQDRHQVVEGGGGGVEAIGAWWDITDRKRAEEELEAVSAEYETVFDGTQDAMFLIEVADDGTFRYIRNNKRHQEATGIDTETMRGKTAYELLGAEVGDTLTSNYQRCLDTGEPISYDETLDLGDGPRTWYTTLTPVFRDGEIRFIVGSARDITKRKELEEKMRYLSYHDELTGLHNRAYMEEELDRKDTPEHLPLSVIMADLNGLKLVNDSFGHAKGDELLRQTAEVINDTCREKDVCARWGGDEFVVLLPQTSELEAAEIARSLEETCEHEELEELGLPVSLSAGYATKTEEETNLQDVLKEAEDRMYRNKLSNSRSTGSGIVSGLLDALEAKGYESREHVLRMQQLARKLGRALGLEPSQLQDLELLISLHDIGKINIPGEILGKAGELTEDEWETLKTHPEMGYRIASRLKGLSHVADKILHHHEHWDGSGYPDGLRGEQIPLLSRIAAVVDAYDAMTSGPYREALSSEEALAEINRAAGTEFDPGLVKLFLEVMEDPSGEDLYAGEQRRRSV